MDSKLIFSGTQHCRNNSRLCYRSFANNKLKGGEGVTKLARQYSQMIVTLTNHMTCWNFRISWKFPNVEAFRALRKVTIKATVEISSYHFHILPQHQHLSSFALSEETTLIQSKVVMTVCTKVIIFIVSKSKLLFFDKSSKTSYKVKTK